MALALAPRIARATALHVTTMEYGDWASAVAALQNSPHAEGELLHVVVTDDAGQRAACGAYQLTFDAAGTTAFARVGCDAFTGATALRLVSRTALFDHDDVVPRPRQLTVMATEIRTGAARGGTQLTGGSAVLCSIAVRPYLNDIEHGTRVFLTPGRFQLRPLASAVSADPAPDGWTLRSGVRSELTVEYEVVDTSRDNAVVLHDRATLGCATASADPPRAATTSAPLAATTNAPPPATSAWEAAPRPASGVVVLEPSGAHSTAFVTTTVSTGVTTSTSLNAGDFSEATSERLRWFHRRNANLAVGGWVTIGAGVGIAGAGLGFLVAASGAQPPPPPTGTLSPTAEADYTQRLLSWRHEHEAAQVWSSVALGAGIAVTVAGVVMAAVGSAPVRRPVDAARNVTRGVRLVSAGIGPTAAGGVSAGATLSF